MKTTTLLLILVCTLTSSYSQWSYSTLQEPKSAMGSCALDGIAYFAGGNNGNGVLKAVESYDPVTDTWDSPGILSVAREFLTSVACDTKVLFAGGMNYANLDVFDQVDMYDIESMDWEVETLSVARFDISAVSYGTRILFAGGFAFPFVTFPTVDIYDIETGEWSVENLSESRGGMACAVVGDLAIFAGGFKNSSTVVSNRVDIYNFTTNTWRTASLSQARAYANATTAGDKVVIAGGVTGMNQPTNTVDIYDASNDSWETATLSQARAWIDAAGSASVNGKAWFAGGGNFNYGFYYPLDAIDIYDEASGEWSQDMLFEPKMNHSVVGTGNYLIIAGGETESNVYTSLVEIYFDPETGIPEPESLCSPSLLCFPNPAHQTVNLFIDRTGPVKEVIIYDHSGQMVFRDGSGATILDVSALKPGIYMVEAVCSQQRFTGKLSIQ